jgi:hypothetical protein
VKCYRHQHDNLLDVAGYAETIHLVHAAEAENEDEF